MLNSWEGSFNSSQLPFPHSSFPPFFHALKGSVTSKDFYLSFSLQRYTFVSSVLISNHCLFFKSFFLFLFLTRSFFSWVGIGILTTRMKTSTGGREADNLLLLINTLALFQHGPNILTSVSGREKYPWAVHPSVLAMRQWHNETC